MLRPTKDEIYVGPLMDGDTVIIPEFCLNKSTQSAMEDDDQLPVSDFNPSVRPTLAELRHAFESTNFKTLIYEGDRAEMTSTFREHRDPKKAEVVPRRYKPISIISLPTRVYYDARDHIFVAEYDPRNLFDGRLEPPPGWITEYDRETGYVLHTSENEADARRQFGQNASYFYGSNESVLTVAVRSYRIVCNSTSTCCNKTSGPFDVAAVQNPMERHFGVGARLCRRQ